MERVKDRRREGGCRRELLPDHCEQSYHMFYLLMPSLEQRQALIKHLKRNSILCVFHYLPLHLSDFYKDKYEGEELTNAVNFSERIVRLPMFFELTQTQILYISQSIKEFFGA